MTKSTENKELQRQIKYSIISGSDQTKVYELTLKKINQLSDYIRECVHEKIVSECKLLGGAKEKYRKEVEKWDRFKQNMCEEIIKKKLKHF